MFHHFHLLNTSILYSLSYVHNGLSTEFSALTTPFCGTLFQLPDLPDLRQSFRIYVVHPSR